MASSAEHTNLWKELEAYVRNPEVCGAINDLYKCWHEIGYPPETLKNLEKCAADAMIKSLADGIEAAVGGEKEQLDQMQRTMAECLERVAIISTELNLSPFQVDSNLALIDQTRILTDKAENLYAKRQERMGNLKDLIVANKRLCNLLGERRYDISHDTVPSHDDLTLFGSVNAKLEHERKIRSNKLKHKKHEIEALLVDLEREPTTTLEKHLLLEPEQDLLLTDQSLASVDSIKNQLFDEKLQLTEEIMTLRDKCTLIRNRLKLVDIESEAFEQRTSKICPSSRDLLRTELQRLEVLKHQNMKKFIQDLRTEIHNLHETCFVGADERATFSNNMHTEVFDDECLEIHETEYNRLKELYNQNREFFQKILRRETVWKKKMETDEKESDPQRFNNRGGQLLRDQQEKSKVEHELKKLDSELAQKAQQWAEEHNRPFYVYGREYLVFISEQKAAYEELREKDKEERKRAKEHGGAVAINGVKRKIDTAHPQKESAKAQKIGGGGVAMLRSPKPVRTAAHHD